MSIKTVGADMEVQESPEVKNLKDLVKHVLSLVKPGHFDISGAVNDESKGGWAKVQSLFGYYKNDPRLTVGDVRLSSSARRPSDVGDQVVSMARRVAPLLENPELAKVFPPELIESIKLYKAALLDECTKKDAELQDAGYASMFPYSGDLAYEMHQLLPHNGTFPKRDVVTCLGELMYWVENNQEALQYFLEMGMMPAPEEMQEIQIEKRRALVVELITTLSENYSFSSEGDGSLRFKKMSVSASTVEFRGNNEMPEDVLRFLEQAVESLLQYDPTAIPEDVVARYRELQAMISAEAVYKNQVEKVNLMAKGKGYYGTYGDRSLELVTSFGPIFEHFVPLSEVVNLLPPQVRGIIYTIRAALPVLEA